MSDSPSLHHYHVPSAQKGVTLVVFLKEQLGISGSKAKALLDARAVWVNEKRVWMAKHRLSANDSVEVRGKAPRAVPPREPLALLYEDEWILAVNKPSGLVSESHKQSVEERLRAQTSNRHLRALHRLDRDTSGCLLFARSSSYRKDYIDLFREKTVEKSYSVLLAGRLPAHPVEVAKKIDGQEALSRFTRVRETEGFCRATCTIVTGKTHQIRKHAGELGCRVLGDKQYQKGPDITQHEKKIPRQMLHADSIIFPCPHTNKCIKIEAPWPDDFQTTSDRFSLT